MPAYMREDLISLIRSRLREGETFVSLPTPQSRHVAYGAIVKGAEVLKVGTLRQLELWTISRDDGKSHRPSSYREGRVHGRKRQES
jgi:hypothetical protein